MRKRGTIALAAVAFAGIAVAACGLSSTGTGVDVSSAGDAGSPVADGAGGADGKIDNDATPDAGANDAADATTCTAPPLDGGLTGALPLSTFVTVGTASYDENNDGKMTLTNSAHSQAGAAWYPTSAPVLASYDLTFDVRIGPGDTAGDGIVFAMLEGTLPGVGDDGDGIGLSGLSNTGYGVIVDMHQSAPTDDATTTLKFVTMPGFNIVAHVGLNEALDDGNPHAVDVSWSGTSMNATLHGPTKTATLSLSNPGFAQTSPAYLGFTASTGGSADAHNEVADITIKDACLE